jgi:hypothetical protein
MSAIEPKNVQPNNSFSSGKASRFGKRHLINMIRPAITASVSNWFDFPGWFWVRFRPRTRPLQWVTTQNPLLKSQHFFLQLSIRALIISQHNQYVKYAVGSRFSFPIFLFASGPIVVELRWKPSHFAQILGLLSKPLNEYRSGRKSETGR